MLHNYIVPNSYRLTHHKDLIINLPPLNPLWFWHPKTEVNNSFLTYLPKLLRYFSTMIWKPAPLLKFANMTRTFRAQMENWELRSMNIDTITDNGCSVMDRQTAPSLFNFCKILNLKIKNLICSVFFDTISKKVSCCFYTKVNFSVNLMEG